MKTAQLFANTWAATVALDEAMTVYTPHIANSFEANGLLLLAFNDGSFGLIAKALPEPEYHAILDIPSMALILKGKNPLINALPGFPAFVAAFYRRIEEPKNPQTLAKIFGLLVAKLNFEDAFEILAPVSGKVAERHQLEHCTLVIFVDMSIFLLASDDDNTAHGVVVPTVEEFAALAIEPTLLQVFGSNATLIRKDLDQWSKVRD